MAGAGALMVECVQVGARKDDGKCSAEVTGDRDSTPPSWKA